MAVSIGTAGWSLPAAHAGAFPAEGSQLQRYAAVMDCVEINSSFYRPHRPQTYERWAASTPAGFRFAVKCPKSITHEARLDGADEALTRFAGEAGALAARLLVGLQRRLAGRQGAHAGGTARGRPALVHFRQHRLGCRAGQCAAAARTAVTHHLQPLPRTESMASGTTARRPAPL